MTTHLHFHLASVTEEAMDFAGDSGIASDVTPEALTPIEELVRAIHDAVEMSQHDQPEGFPPLSAVSLQLQTLAERTREGGLKLWIFAFGSKGKREEASTIEIQLAVPRPPAFATSTSHRMLPALTDAINSARAAVLAANRGKQRLITNKIDINIKFVVARARSGGFEIVPIGLEGKGQLTRSNTHSIKVIFEANNE